jgi:hypothetical protein
MKRLHISSVIVIGAVATLISAIAPAAPNPNSEPSAPAGNCGTKDNPCPLQKWMSANMGPSSTEDPMPFDALASNFAKVASKSPGADYPEWQSIAKGGADAAKAKDAGKVKAACKSCHDKYKKQFKEKNREWSFP